jgi:hypothetical protein
LCKLKLRESMAACVQDDLDDEPLKVSQVQVSEVAAQHLGTCWKTLPQCQKSLIDSFEHLKLFVQEVLSFDFRSAHQRSLQQQALHENKTSARGQYHVRVLGLDLEYSIVGGQVVLESARFAPVLRLPVTRSCEICREAISYTPRQNFDTDTPCKTISLFVAHYADSEAEHSDNPLEFFLDVMLCMEPQAFRRADECTGKHPVWCKHCACFAYQAYCPGAYMYVPLFELIPFPEQISSGASDQGQSMISHFMLHVSHRFCWVTALPRSALTRRCAALYALQVVHSFGTCKAMRCQRICPYTGLPTIRSAPFMQSRYILMSENGVD